MSLRIDSATKAELSKKGFVVKDLPPGVLDEMPRATYYKPDGEPMPNLPNDSISRKWYLRRGFTLYPPDVPRQMKPAMVGVDDVVPKAKTHTKVYVYVCEDCGREFTLKVALLGHKKSHKIVGVVREKKTKEQQEQPNISELEEVQK